MEKQKVRRSVLALGPRGPGRGVQRTRVDNGQTAQKPAVEELFTLTLISCREGDAMQHYFL